MALLMLLLIASHIGAVCLGYGIGCADTERAFKK